MLYITDCQFNIKRLKNRKSLIMKIFDRLGSKIRLSVYIANEELSNKLMQQNI